VAEAEEEVEWKYLHLHLNLNLKLTSVWLIEAEIATMFAVGLSTS
jgi:hypothetical protein